MKRFLIILFVLLLLISAVSMCATADTPEEGTISSAALTYFEGIANKLPQNCHYVAYKSDDYTAEFVYGYGLELDGTTISSDDDIVRVTYNARGSGSSGYYTPTLSEAVYNSFNLTTSDKSIIYSSLGSWATLGDPKKDTVSYILWALVGLIFIFVTFKMLRNRRHYINI